MNPSEEEHDSVAKGFIVHLNVLSSILGPHRSPSVRSNSTPSHDFCEHVHTRKYV